MHTTLTTARSSVRPVLRALVGGIAMAVAMHAGASTSSTITTYRGIQVEVVGEGRPVLMIPGFNSAGDTWRKTCEALQADRVQCHIVTLPGFAGQPAAKDAKPGAWTSDMGDRLLAYVRERKLQHPVAMGHSLGGFLAMDMAVKQPQAFERLVIVDSLPFYSAAFNPVATPELMKPMAEATRAGMQGQDDASFRAALPMHLRGMTRDPAGIQTLTTWSLASDRATSGQAMYELMTRDLRGEVAAIRVPTLVLGAWAAYQPMGASEASTRGVFEAGYRQLPGVRIEMSKAGYHFLMWDDPTWLQAQVRGFIGAETRQ